MNKIAQVVSLGSRHERAGQLAEAERAYRHALQLDPDNPDALHGMGTLALRAGRNDEAIHWISQAIRRDRSQAAYHANLGESYRQAGNVEQAIACNQTALRLSPGMTAIRANLANLYRQQGNLALAEQLLRELTRDLPDDVSIRLQLGHVLLGLGKPTDAEAAFRRAARIDPREPAALVGIGLSMHRMGKLPLARAAFESALAIQPADARAHNDLGNVFKELGSFVEAERHYREAMGLDPNLAGPYGNLGGYLTLEGRHQEAIDYLTEATRRAPDFGLAFCNLAVSLREMDRLDEAVAASHRAIALHPDQWNVHSNLGVCYKALGRLDEAIEEYRTAIRLDPKSCCAGSNLLYVLNYHPAYDPPQVFAEHRAWGQAHADPLTAAAAPHDNERTPGRRLRLGYVSSHFYDHAVNFFTEPILAAHDHSQFEVYCYSGGSTTDDATARLRSYADQWRDIATAGDEQASTMVRADKIDILVDLAGHIAGHRLLLFARKPAPLQVTYIGYQNTTGMAAMDYRLTDEWADPPGTTDAFYTEKLVRLPRSFFCYRPSPNAPPVGSLPATANGLVTFGSFNNFAKVTPEVLATWAQLMAEVPRSRMVILAADVPSLRKHLADAFASRGIDETRWTLEARRPRRQYLDLVSQVDIALDPFPFNGHTTTCDALWQGVPVITLAGRTYAARFGSTAHVNMNLEDLIARSTEEYVEIAARLAGDLARLAGLRSGLRERMAASAICDPAGFTRNLEAEYRRMWVDWCSQPQK
jgi:predicted O-linked N-acetylglucosamine transferase (SPINDLY family)